MFWFHYATWEFNPFQPRASFASDYEKDAILAERDFGANPPAASNPLITDPVRFWSSIDLTAKPTASFRVSYPRDKSGLEYVGAELEQAKFDRGRPLYLFGDAGKSFDQFALIGCSALWVEAFDQITSQSARMAQAEASFLGGSHPQANEHLIGGTYLKPFSPTMGGREQSLVTIHEFSLRILPEKGKPVWFESVLDVVKGLMKSRTIAQVAFDHWNSEATIQQISNLGIGTELVTLHMEDYVRTVQDAMVGRIRMLPPAETDHLSLDHSKGTMRLGLKPEQMSAEGTTIYEMMKLERDKDMRRVYNPKKGLIRGRDSDDLAACLVGAHRLVQESIGKTVRGFNTREQRRSKELGGSSAFVGGIARMGRW